MPVILHPVGFRDALVSVAKGEFGTVESSENSGARIRQYQAATNCRPAAWKWCAAFVCWCYQSAAARMAPALLSTRPITARAYGFESWGEKHAALFRGSDGLSPGDIVIFSFSHVGIVCSVNDPALLFSSAEGNTSPPAGGRDGVYLRHRSFSSVRSYVRLYESTTYQS